MARERTTRLREFEQMEFQTLSRRKNTPGQCRSLGLNTMEAPEELVEQRRQRHRKHVSMAANANSTRNELLENVILLVMLIGSIYGLYRLAIHLLNQV